MFGIELLKKIRDLVNLNFLKQMSFAHRIFDAVSKAATKVIVLINVILMSNQKVISHALSVLRLT